MEQVVAPMEAPKVNMSPSPSPRQLACNCTETAVDCMNDLELSENVLIANFDGKNNNNNLAYDFGFIELVNEVFNDGSEQGQSCTKMPQDIETTTAQSGVYKKPGTQQTTITTSTTTKIKRNMKTGRRKSQRQSATCEWCQRTFTDAYNLRIHLMTHSGEKPHACELCGKRFRQYAKLKIHHITHTNQKPHACDICGKGFRYANYLAIHRRLHTGEKPYKCAHCVAHFHSLHARRVHTKLLHPGEQNGNELNLNNMTYTCPLCGKVLSDQCYLTAHLQRAHYKQRNFDCQSCSKQFFTASELKHHQIAHTTRLRAFACDFCSARFLRKSNYKQHLKKHIT